jgi:ATP-dependent DNA ligase
MPPTQIDVEGPLNIYPPRPLGSIAPGTVGHYRGYIAQYKYNDIRLLIHLLPGNGIRITNRHKGPLKSYRLSETMSASLRSLKLDPSAYHLLDGGLMRTPAAEDGERTIVLWDLLVEDGRYLLDSTYVERYRRLRRAAGNPRRRERETGHALALQIRPHLWLPEIFRDRFNDRFKSAQKVEQLEGLLLKNPSGRLEWGTREDNNGAWQIRARKTTGRHVF